MLKKTITYTNYDGVEKTKDFYFNLKTSELIDLNYSSPKGFIDYTQKIIDSKDDGALWKAFRDIVLMAYGEKSEDGERFMKSPEISKAFEETEAFSVLVTELIQVENAASDFVNGIMPKDLAEKASQ